MNPVFGKGECVLEEKGSLFGRGETVVAGIEEGGDGGWILHFHKFQVAGFHYFADGVEAHEPDLVAGEAGMGEILDPGHDQGILLAVVLCDDRVASQEQYYRQIFFHIE